MRQPVSLMLTVAAAALLVLAAASSTAAASRSARGAVLEANNFTGCAAIRVGSANAVVYQEGFGAFDFRGTINMPVDARFPVASNTKVYVAISLYQLQERGLVDLRRNVQDYLDATDFAAFGAPSMTSYCPVWQDDPTRTCRNITFEQLLSMQACIPDTDFQYLPFPGTLGLVFGRYLGLDLVCLPGSMYYYSNPAFMLGAYFVEKLSGMRWESYLAKYIHGPVGQANTYFGRYDGQFGSDPLRVDEWFDLIDRGNQSRLLGRGRCSREFDLGSASGAGGIVSTQLDEAVLYFTLFNFSANSTGAPLFKNRSSLLDLVRPRTFIAASATPANMPLYYAQGLFVNSLDATQPVPPVIQYEGEIVCSHTANLFFVAELDPTGERVVKPAVMSQVWSAVPVFYPTATEYASAAANGTGFFLGIVNQWPKRAALMEMASQILSTG